LLDEYFKGHAPDFNGLPVRLSGTDFDKRVWKAIGEIPCGEVRSYKYLARGLHRPNSFRAVANACGRNLLPIIIPCHRVIRVDGSVGGWSGGGGVAVKERLIAMERNVCSGNTVS